VQHAIDKTKALEQCNSRKMAERIHHIHKRNTVQALPPSVNPCTHTRAPQTKVLQKDPVATPQSEAAGTNKSKLGCCRSKRLKHERRPHHPRSAPRFPQDQIVNTNNFLIKLIARAGASSCAYAEDAECVSSSISTASSPWISSMGFVCASWWLTASVWQENVKQ
jgi:hypothetical protein